MQLGYILMGLGVLAAALGISNRKDAGFLLVALFFGLFLLYIGAQMTGVLK